MTKPQTMKAYITRSYGADARFEVTDLPIPEPAEGQIRIAVKATSLNPVDNKLLRMGLDIAPELPAVLHSDVAGLVHQVGAKVTGFQRGDEVYACAGGFKGLSGGALAEYMVADTRFVAHKPRTLDFAAAAALPLVSITAWEGLLDRAKLSPGQHVLIHAGVGGVGHIAIQLAKIKGSRVATTVSSRENAEIASSLGADETILHQEQSVEEYVQELTDGQGFDIVFDTVGGENLDRSFAATRNKGQVVSIQARTTHDLSLPFGRGLSIHLESMLIPLLTEVGREKQGEILREVAKLVDEGRLRPLIHKQRFTFDEVNAAHALFEANGHTGKILLTP